jgi:subtilisin family serine protease
VAVTDRSAATGSQPDGNGGDSAVVALVTGHRVVVSGPAGSRSYAVTGEAGPVTVVHADRDTYVIPAGVDLRRFDPELFNVDRRLRAGATTGGGGESTVPVVVQLDDSPGVRTADPATERRRLVETAEAAGIEPTAVLESATAVAGGAPADGSAYRALAKDPAVTAVTLDPYVTTTSGTVADAAAGHNGSDGNVGPDGVGSAVRPTLEDATRLVGAARARDRYGVDGRNVTVAVLDTGVDETHPDLRGRQAAERDFTGENTTADHDGHGTHVAGILAGDGTASDGTYRGVAPNATYLDVRVLGSFGGGRLSDVIDGLEWATDRGADVASLSLGAPTGTPRADDLLAAAVADATAQGTLVVAAAGNGGPTALTVGTPGIAADALTVGATNRSGTGVAGFSSRGPTPGLFVKPDVVAPGTAVTSAAAAAPYPNRSYVELSGTSMATPVVSGVAALVLAADPTAAPDRVRARLASTADPLGSATAYDAGTGRVNATAALGAELVATPPSVDFGGYLNASRNATVGSSPLNSSPSARARRTVSLVNRHETARTVDLNVSAESVVGRADAIGTVSLNRTRVRVPGGGRAHVRVTVPTEGPPGVFAGTVTATVVGSSTDAPGDSQVDTFRAAFGWARAAQVTVAKRPLGNGSTAGDMVVLDRRREGGFGRPVVATLGDPLYAFGGPVTVLSAGVDETGGPANATLLTAGTASVDGPTTVRLDESATVTHAADLSALAAPAPTVVGSEASVRGPSGSALTVARPGRHPARVTPDDGVGVGLELLAVGDDPDAADPGATGTDGDTPGSGSSTAPLDAPVAYHLEFGTDGVASARTYRPRPAELATFEATYHRAESAQTFALAPRATGPLGVDETVVGFGLGDRRRQRVAVTTAGRHGLGLQATGAVDPGWQTSTRRDRLTPGETRSVELNGYPLQPRLASWSRSDRGVGFVVQFRTDRAGNGHSSTPSQRRYTLLRNGTRVSNQSWPFGAAFAFGVDAPAGTTLEVRTRTATRSGPLDSRASASYRATVRPEGDSTPPRIGSLDVRNLRPNASVTGSTAVVYVAVDEPETTRVRATLTDGTDAVRASTSTVGSDTVALAFDTRRLDGRVSLALEAIDRAGNVVSLAVEGAFRVRTVTPFDRGLPSVDGFRTAPPLDLDGDGVYADADGNGRVDAVDAVTLAFTDWPAVNDDPTKRRALDVNGDGTADFRDALALFERVRG